MGFALFFNFLVGIFAQSCSKQCAQWLSQTRPDLGEGERGGGSSQDLQRR